MQSIETFYEWFKLKVPSKTRSEEVNWIRCMNRSVAPSLLRKFWMSCSRSFACFDYTLLKIMLCVFSSKTSLFEKIFIKVQDYYGTQTATELKSKFNLFTKSSSIFSKTLTYPKLFFLFCYARISTHFWGIFNRHI